MFFVMVSFLYLLLFSFCVMDDDVGGLGGSSVKVSGSEVSESSVKVSGSEVNGGLGFFSRLRGGFVGRVLPFVFAAGLGFSGLVGCGGREVPSLELSVSVLGSDSVGLEAVVLSEPNGPVEEVGFFRDGVLVGSDSSRDDGFSFVDSGLGAGSYSYWVLGSDSSGVSGRSGSVEVSVLGVNLADEFWEGLGGDPGVVVSGFGYDGVLSVNDKWLLSFLHDRMLEGMSSDTANMFTASKIVYYNGVVVPGFADDFAFRDDERLWVSDYYFGNSFHMGFLFMKDYLKGVGYPYDLSGVFPSPPSMGLLEFQASNNLKVDGVVPFGYPINLPESSVSPFRVKKGSLTMTLFDYWYDDRSRMDSGLDLFMGLKECKNSVENGYSTSFLFGVDTGFVFSNYGDYVVNINNFAPFPMKVVGLGYQPVPGGTQDDVLINLFSDSHSKSLRHEKFFIEFTHMDLDTTSVGLGDVVNPGVNFTSISDAKFHSYPDGTVRVSVFDDIVYYSEKGNLRRLRGGKNPYSSLVSVERFAFDVNRPESFLGSRDPTEMVISKTDVYGNLLVADVTNYSLFCLGHPKDLRFWFNPLSVPLATYLHDFN